MAAARHPLFRQPQRLSELARKRLEAAARRMHLALPRELERHRAHLDGTERQLSAEMLSAGIVRQQISTIFHIFSNIRLCRSSLYIF